MSRVLAMRWIAVGGMALMTIVWIATWTRAARPRTLDVMTCPGGFGSCEPMVVPPSPGTRAWLYAALVVLILTLPVVVLTAFGPATRATLHPEGHLTFAGGIVPQRPVEVDHIERISVGALYLRGLLFIHDGGRFPTVMLAPVDGITRLLDAARRRDVTVELDGL